MIEAKEYIKKIQPYKPGKSKAGNQKAIKLSSNENSLGISPLALENLQKNSQILFRYPDGNCSELKKALAKKHQITAEQITCGAGSDEIISFLNQAYCQEGDEIIYSQHGFLMYAIYAQKTGAKAVPAKEVNLKANINNILSNIGSRTKIIFIANPNNPTGSYLNHKELEELIEKTPKNILLVIDQAYCEYMNKADYPNALPLVKKYENLVVLQTFSKIYGLANLRIGWSYSSEKVATALNACRGPFNVSGAGQVAAIGAIKDTDFIRKSKEHNKKWLTIFQKSFEDLAIKYYPSQANFILIDLEKIDKCQKLNQFLLENGIIVREMAAYGLKTCLRISIGNDSENKTFISCLKNFK